MRWFSYVPEEDAGEGAVFAPTIEVNFAEALKDTDVVRMCLSYRPASTKKADGTEVASTNESALEVMCAYTKTSWADQEWQIKWAKTVLPGNLPNFVAGDTSSNMPTYLVTPIADNGWELEASYLDVASSKQVLLDLTRWQDVL